MLKNAASGAINKREIRLVSCWLLITGSFSKKAMSIAKESVRLWRGWVKAAIKKSRKSRRKKRLDPAPPVDKTSNSVTIVTLTILVIF